MVSPRYIARRSLSTGILIWLVLTFMFILFELMPGDMASAMATVGASPSYIQNFQAQWGLDQPVHRRYLIFMKNYLTFEFGTSMRQKISVWELVGIRIFNSFILVAPALVVAYVLGSIIGTILGAQRGTALEKYGVLSAIVLGSIPGWFTGILLIVVLATWMGWFPTGGLLSPGVSYGEETWWRVYLTGDFLRHYFLPFSTIVIRYLYVPMLLMRTTVVEVAGQDFSFYQRMVGLSRYRRLRHLAKHASLPVITNFPLSLTSALGGLVLIEIVFNWPGIGFTLVRAVLQRDLPVVRFVFILVALAIVFGNLLVDLVYGFIDPRVDIEG